MIVLSRKDPDEVIEYVVDWTTELGTDETIDTYQFIVEDGLTKVSDAKTSKKTQIKVSGGESGKTYQITNRLTTSLGQTLEETLSLPVLNSSDVPGPPVLPTSGDTSYTVEQLQALEQAVASGVTSVRYEGKEVTYRSMSDLMQAMYFVRRALYGSTTKRKLYTRTRDDKAL